jgi:hypothetical protein
MASSLSVVMSATASSKRAAPTSALIRGLASLMAASLSRPFGLRFRPQIHGAAHADIWSSRKRRAARLPLTRSISK